MGECFMGIIPKRLHTIDSLSDNIYYPERALSSRQGYLLNEKFNDYLPIHGGVISGLLSTYDIKPDISDVYNIGTPSRYYNNGYIKEIYSNHITGDLIGNASSATKLKSQFTIAITGAVTGNVMTDASGKAIINTTANHTHDVYLPFTGGNMIGNIKMSNGASLLDSNNKVAIQFGSNYNIGMGMYDSGTANNLNLYSNTGMTFNNKSGNFVYTQQGCSPAALTLEPGVVRLSNLSYGSNIEILQGVLRYNGNNVYHTGNRPSPADIGALSMNGTGAMSGTLNLNMSGDGKILAAFNTERPWYLSQISSGPSTMLGLGNASNKSILLYGNNGVGYNYADLNNSKGWLRITPSSYKIESAETLVVATNGDSGSTINAIIDDIASDHIFNNNENTVSIHVNDQCKIVYSRPVSSGRQSWSGTYKPIWASEFAVKSDIRSKKDIQSISRRESVSILTRLNPVTFNYNTDDNSEAKTRGLIAQQVQEIMHYTGNDGQVYSIDNGDKSMMMNYVELIPDLINTVNHLIHKNDELELKLGLKTELEYPELTTDNTFNETKYRKE
jgi:hypothetical protein